jgi:hypothetical protein
MDEPPDRLERTRTYIRLSAQAIALKLSYAYLRLRLWLERRKAAGFEDAVELARKRMHAACQQAAQTRFESELSNFSMRQLQLPAVILQALEWEKIDDLKKLGECIHGFYNLQGLANIGPMREQLIEKAYVRSAEKLALRSCKIDVMRQELSQYVELSETLASVRARFLERIDEIEAHERICQVDFKSYRTSEDYRQTAAEEASKVWLDADACFAEMRKALDAAKQGTMEISHVKSSNQALQLRMEEEHQEITFRLKHASSRAIEIEDGEVAE